MFSDHVLQEQNIEIDPFLHNDGICMNDFGTNHNSENPLESYIPSLPVTNFMPNRMKPIRQ